MTEKRRWLLAGAVLLSAPAIIPALASAEPIARPASARVSSSKPPLPQTTTPPAHAPHRTLRDRLMDAEKALAMAGNEQQARELSDKAEGLRTRALTGGVRMLLSDSQEALEKHEFQRAQDDLTSAITIQPDQTVLYRQRASIRLAAGDNDGTIADLGVALQADPGDATAWGLLAEAEHDRHQPEAALRAFHEMLRLNPKSPDADKQLKTLQTEADGQQD